MGRISKIWYNMVMLQRYNLDQNNFLHKEIEAFYSCKYIKLNSDNTNSFSGMVSDDIRTLKNTFNEEIDNIMLYAKDSIRIIATTDIKAIINEKNIINPVVVCVPRSKASFSDKQLLFQKAISEAAENIGAVGGSYYIKRIIDTKTTHLIRTKKGDISGDGDLPYPGITKKTCHLCGSVRGRNIILVDDIYTKTVNVDEDCCQFLLDNGANSVILYTICKTELEVKNDIFQKYARKICEIHQKNS